MWKCPDYDALFQEGADVCKVLKEKITTKNWYIECNYPLNQI